LNMLSNALLATLKSPLTKWSSAKLSDFGVGRKLSYALVEGRLGFAFVPDAEAPDFVPEPGMYVRKLFLHAWKGPVETSLALASMSALTQLWIDSGGEVEMPPPKLAEALGIEKGETVILIGHMKGIIKDLLDAGASVRLYEDDPQLRCEAKEMGVEAYPGSYILLEGEADVIIATGSSLLDPRSVFAFEKIPARVKALIGPTATIHPYMAKLLGATHVGGTYVPREEQGKVLSLLKAGYGYRRLLRAGLLRKWFAKAS